MINNNNNNNNGMVVTSAALGPANIILLRCIALKPYGITCWCLLFYGHRVLPLPKTCVSGEVASVLCVCVI